MQVRPLSSHCHLKTSLSLCAYKELCFEGCFVSKVISSPSPMSVQVYVCMYRHLSIKNSFSNIILPLEEVNILLSHCTFQYSLDITKEEKILMEILLRSILGKRGREEEEECCMCVTLTKKKKDFNL